MNKRYLPPILEASERFVFMKSYKEDFNPIKKTLIVTVSPHISLVLSLSICTHLYMVIVSTVHMDPSIQLECRYKTAPSCICTF